MGSGVSYYNPKLCADLPAWRKHFGVLAEMEEPDMPHWDTPVTRERADPKRDNISFAIAKLDAVLAKLREL